MTATGGSLGGKSFFQFPSKSNQVAEHMGLLSRVAISHVNKSHTEIWRSSPGALGASVRCAQSPIRLVNHTYTQ